MAEIPDAFMPWVMLFGAGLACVLLMSINETLEAMREMLGEIGAYYEAKAEVQTATAERIWQETQRDFPEEV